MLRKNEIVSAVKAKLWKDTPLWYDYDEEGLRKLSQEFVDIVLKLARLDETEKRQG